jgi:filamentous hemagglutinin
VRTFIADPEPPPATGGRLGSAATRAQIAELAQNLMSRGWTITGGGGVQPEEYLPPIGGGRSGGNYVDITATKNGAILRVNTIDTLSDGVTPTSREAAAAALIRSKIGPSAPFLLIPKNR